MNYLHHTLPLLGAAALLAALPDPAPAEPAHGIAMIGDPALPAGFDHLPYVNPDASRGGRVTYGVIGSFDSLNPMIVQGGLTSARGLSTDTLVGNLVFESLLMRSSDEPFTLYGFIAETVETPPDRSWVEFTLNPKAHFSDGTAVTVDDVVFSLELLRDKGRPNYRSYYSKVERIERVGERGVRFHIANAHDRELPLILGLMPVLPKHAIKAETFDKSTLVPMVGTGPYLLAEVSPPNYVVYKRNPDYWAEDLPIKRGLDNFDEIRFEYYRDDNSLFEAFKKGLYQINPEGDPARWNTAYDFPAIKDGRVVMESFRTGAPKGMSGFAFNTRRPVFANVGVRKALATLLDFDWINENLYHRAFVRAGGYFNDSELSSIGRPADEKERKLLAPFSDAVAPEVMDGTYKPVSASGRDERKVLRDALAVLKEAGYELRGDALVETATNKPLTFEIMVTTKEDERLALAYQRTLDRIGVKISIRSVDSAQYQQRRTTFDFDVIRNTWPVSLSPGNEQNFRWSQQAADTDGSFNFPGAKEPAIDAMIQALLEASTREDFVAAIRALDRVLISGYYAVPLFYLPEQWLAHWRSVERPQTTPVTGYNLPTWWAKQN
jgi:peptide/nickel transport system substrate-binding protein